MGVCAVWLGVPQASNQGRALTNPALTRFPQNSHVIAEKAWRKTWERYAGSMMVPTQGSCALRSPARSPEHEPNRPPLSVHMSHFIPFLLSACPKEPLRDVARRECARTNSRVPAHSKFVAPVNKFLSFGTQLQTGTNPGEISQAGLRRKEVLRRKDGLPAEVHTANIGKEGVQNPLGQRGSHTSFISGESFLHDSRHGEQFPFSLSQESGVQPDAGRMSKEDGAAGGSIAPWEAKQLERWEQHQRSREQIRAAADGSMAVLSRAAHSSSGSRNMDMGSRTGPRGSSPAEGGTLRSTLRGSLTGSPDSRKSISWEDEGTRVISPYSDNTEWDQARRARDALPLHRKGPEEGEASGTSVPVSVLHGDVSPGIASRNQATGQKMTEGKFRIKSMDRVTEIRQQEQDFEVQGPR